MRVGSRSSPLALAQTRLVTDRLGPDLEVITTERLRAAGGGPLPADKRRWVADLEEALLEGRIDLAVHSAKDLPGQEREGLTIGCVLPRGPAADSLVCRQGEPGRLADLPAGATVGTGSIRRAAQLRALRPDLEVLPLAGNVDTRLRRLRDGDFAAIVLAQAGLKRLGHSRLGRPFALKELVPAPGQGAIVVQLRAGEEELGRRLAPLHDPLTAACLAAERATARALGADCNTALGVHARAIGHGQLEVIAWLGLPDGSVWLRDRAVGKMEQPELLGHLLADRLLSAGGEALLAGRRPDGG